MRAQNVRNLGLQFLVRHADAGAPGAVSKIRVQRTTAVAVAAIAKDGPVERI